MKKIFELILLFSISYLFCFSIINVSAKPLDYFEDINYIDNFTEENIEDYDLYHLLSYDEANVLFKWLEDSYKLIRQRL